MRLVVTGGAGYIGSVVTRQLLAAGHRVTVVDDLSTGHRDAVPTEAIFIESDIRNIAPEQLDGIDGVLHFAARSLVADSVVRPADYWTGNVGATMALLDAMRKARTPRLVFSSTAAVYGVPTSSPITEDTPASPINPYGATKAAIDSMIGNFCSAYGLAAVSLRYFNVAGALADARERHDPETHLIPNALAVAAGRRDAVDVYGHDYDTPDGTCVRDYIHVVDLGEAHLAAIDATEPRVHQIINLGSTAGFSVLQVLDAVRDVTGHPVPMTSAERRAGDPPILVASNVRAGELLGWQPTRSLREMVADAWAATSSAPLRS